MSKTKQSPEPVETAALAESAMLVDLTISQWAGKKTDKRASREFNEQHQAGSTVGDYRKKLLGECGPLKAIHDITGEANRTHRELTLPWSDDGRRALAAVGFMNYQTVMGELESKFNKAVPVFLKEYPNLCNEARHQLGTLYLLEEYPSYKEMAIKFAFGWRITALPQAGDFRVNIKESEAKLIKERIEADTASTLKSALGDAYARVAKDVEHMIDRLRAYKMTEEGLVGKFHDSLVTNINAVADMIVGLNITGGPELPTLSKRLKAELTEFSAQELRDSKATRQVAIKRAQDILSTIQSIAA